MLRLVAISVCQCFFLALGQVFLKLAMVRMSSFSWTWNYFKELLTNWQFALCGICMGAATILWLYILKNFEFSAAYPMISISYIFGMLAAIFIFHETIPMTRWIGVALIMIGVILVAK